MLSSLLIATSALMGAAGVGLAAAAAHVASGVGLDSAAYMLLFHATAVIATVAAVERGVVSRPLGLVAAAGMLTGTVLFSGDLALRGLVQLRIWGMAAPTGGMIMIGAWIVLALAAVTTAFRR